MCWCCCCCKVQCIPFRVLEISAMSFAVGIALMQYVYIDVWTWFVNSYTRNVLAAAVCCALLLVFAACIVMLLFREFKVSRFRKISLLCYFICFMGFLLPLAFLQPAAAALRSDKFFLYNTGSDGPKAAVNPFVFKSWLFQIHPDFADPDTRTYVYKNVSETPPKNDCGDWSRDYEPYLELDVHLPQNKSSTGAGEGGKYPLLFHVHGGGWSVGDKSLAAMSFGHWTSRGYAIVSSQYSLRCYGHDAATMQADLADAFHFVEERADELNLDFSRVTAIGESAGGHLAMLLGYTLKATSDPAKNAFRSVFNIYGLADMERWDRDGWTSGGSKGTAFPCDEEGSLIQDLAGGCSEEQLKAISPVHYIDENTPPTISIHGTMDSLVSYQQSTALHATLDEAGVDNYLISCPGWDHVLDVGYFGPQQLLRYALQRLLAVDSNAPEVAGGEEEAWGWGIYAAVVLSSVFALAAGVFIHYMDRFKGGEGAVAMNLSDKSRLTLGVDGDGVGSDGVGSDGVGNDRL